MRVSILMDPALAGPLASAQPGPRLLAACGAGSANLKGQSGDDAGRFKADARARINCLGDSPPDVPASPAAFCNAVSKNGAPIEIHAAG